MGPVSTEKKNWVYLRKSGLQWLLNRFQPFLDLSKTIPSEIRVAVVAQPVSTEKKNWGIPSEIMVAVVAQPVSTIPGSLPNYTFGNQGCSGCSTGFNRKKKLGYTFRNQGCSGCSTGFNHSWISPNLYLRKSGLQWLLNRFQPKKKIGVYLRKSWLQWLLNRFQPFLDLSQTIPSEIRVAVVAQPVSTEKKLGYTFGNQGCSGCST